MWQRFYRVVLGLMFVALIIGCSALLATVFATRQIASAIERSISVTQAESAPEIANPVSLSFFEALDIPEAELRDWFLELHTTQNIQQVRFIVTLQRDDGCYLIDSSVGVRWKDGSEWIRIGKSGLAEFALSPSQLTGLTLIVPEDFRDVKQRSIPIGHQYEQAPKLHSEDFGMLIISDDAIQQELVRNLQRVKLTEPIRKKIDAEAGLRRLVYPIELSKISAGSFTPEQLYQIRMPSVVVIGFLKPSGEISQATGFVVDRSGIIVTNFHAVDKPEAIACGILTADHKFYRVQKILAGNPTDDLALLQVDCDGLLPIRLAENNAQVGAEVFAISHPHSNYFSLTHGQVTRYFDRVRHAFPSVRLGVTTEFAEGSSGGPLMDISGNVIGVLSATQDERGQMVHREAIPVAALRRMVGAWNDDVRSVESATVTSLETDFSEPLTKPPWPRCVESGRDVRKSEEATIVVEER